MLSVSCNKILLYIFKYIRFGSLIEKNYLNINIATHFTYKHLYLYYLVQGHAKAVKSHKSDDILYKRFDLPFNKH